jgi:hypothetical protein
MDMKYTANIFLCLFLTVSAANPQTPRPRPYPPIETPAPASEFESFDGRIQLEPEDALRQQAKYEEDEFVKRLNSLLSALRDFSSNYNSAHVINVKKVKEVRKALHELEKSAWFKSYKAD